MGWWKSASFLKREVEIGFSSTGQFHRHVDRGRLPDEHLRLSGRRLRLIVRRKPWQDMTEEERFERLREHV